jgi:hypothetical protein
MLILDNSGEREIYKLKKANLKNQTSHYSALQPRVLPGGGSHFLPKSPIFLALKTLGH